MTMEEVSVCQPPVTVTADRGGRGIIHTVPHALTKVHVDEDDAGCDAEVMQVVGNEVNLRSKKQRINGCAISDDELNRERPMSWEGELSDDEGELMSPRGNMGHPCIPNGCNGQHDANGGVESVVISTGPYVCPPQPPSSPMCISEREDSNHFPEDIGPSEGTKVQQVNKKMGREGNTIVMVTCTNGTSGHSSPVPPVPVTTAFTPSASPLLGRGNVTAFGVNNTAILTAERLQMAHASAAYESQLIGHRSPAQARHVSSYSRPYSQSPSPVPTRPTSSSSSRSSYSPVQSPLLSRHVSSASSLYSHTQSPLLPRHTAGTSSDGSVYSPSSSPLQGRHLPSDGVVYSPSQSPSQGRHSLQEGLAGFSPSQSPVQIRSSLLRPVPFPSTHSPNQQHHRNSVTPDQPSANSVDGGVRIQSSYHYCHTEQSLDGRSQVSPVSQNTIQDTRTTNSSASVASSASDESNASDFSTSSRRLSADNSSEEGRMLLLPDVPQGALGLSGPPSISRQQLLSGPCPICGDRISGFHYGIFSCESCKGFFKRTVQNKKNYVCLRGANCHIAINTRKKCPACRFDKCLKMGMKLEAIREDRTRGGRSTYQCSYTLPTQLGDGRVISPPDSGAASGVSDSSQLSSEASASKHRHDSDRSSSAESMQPVVPPLIQEILAVEHLWHYTDKEINRLSEQCQQDKAEGDPDFLSNLCNIADHRLYKIVKWCKSLPLFKEIQIDDQIALLINSWCELLLLSCCYRSIPTPNEIRVSLGKSVTLQEAQAIGMGPVIERMLNLTEHLRRLQVDQYEYVCLKVIILLTSDASGLKEPEKVRGCQKLVIEALQTYTRTHYSQHPSKFGELLLRIPELERACQVGKDSLANKQRGGEMPSFNLLMELLRGDH